MSRADIVQSIYLEFITAAALERKSQFRYRRGDETIVVLELHRSPYGRQYFVNVGVWLQGLGIEKAPKEAKCPIRSSLDRLVPDSLEHRTNDLLDLDGDCDDPTRRAELLNLLRTELLPVIDGVPTVESLRSGPGHHLVRHSVVTEYARELINGEVRSLST